MGGGNLNLDGSSGTSQHADCLLRLTHLRGLHIQNLPVSQSAIYWPDCPASPFHDPPSVRLLYSARVCVLGGNLELALCVVVKWVWCNSTLHPQTLFFPSRSGIDTPLPFLDCLRSGGPFLTLCSCACAAMPCMTPSIVLHGSMRAVSDSKGYHSYRPNAEERYLCQPANRHESSLVARSVPAARPSGHVTRADGRVWAWDTLVPIVWSLVGSPVSGRLAKLRGLRSVCCPGETSLAAFLVSPSSFTRREEGSLHSRCFPGINP